MAIHDCLYSSRSEEWPTPQYFFAELDAEFKFTLDPCATPQNAKCPTFFTKEQNGLLQDWGTHVVFCNPPYGRSIGDWVEKCYAASRQGATVVLLVARAHGHALVPRLRLRQGDPNSICARPPQIR